MPYPARAIGCTDFITKPIDVADVTLRVRNAVQIKKLFDSLQAAYQQSIDVKALQQKIVQMIIRDTRKPLGKALELLEPRKRASKTGISQKAVEQACQILRDLAKRFDQLSSSGETPAIAKAA